MRPTLDTATEERAKCSSRPILTMVVAEYIVLEIALCSSVLQRGPTLQDALDHRRLPPTCYLDWNCRRWHRRARCHRRPSPTSRRLSSTRPRGQLQGFTSDGPSRDGRACTRLGSAAGRSQGVRRPWDAQSRCGMHVHTPDAQACPPGGVQCSRVHLMPFPRDPCRFSGASRAVMSTLAARYPDIVERWCNAIIFQDERGLTRSVLWF